MGRIKGELGIIQMYELYLHMTDEPLDEKVYKKVVREFNKKMSARILEGRTVNMPMRFSDLCIRKRKMSYKKMHLDYKHYNETGEVAYHLNMHSDDYYARWHWTKSRCIIKGKTPYSFTASRANKRALSEIMQQRNGHTRFMQTI